MEISDQLVDLAQKRAEGFALEGFVKGRGPADAKVMLVGEAPGETEVGNLIPFSGRAGKELMKFMAIAGLTREYVFITSAVRSRPYRYGEKIDRKTGEKIKRRYNRPPTQKEILAHAPVLDAEIQMIQPKIILAMGNVGLKRLIGKAYQVSEQHGKIYRGPVQHLAHLEDRSYSWTEEVYTVLATFHPASIFYNRQLLPLIEADWQLLRQQLEAR
ncbi:uracil-DNA glycosylase [Listeria costaricensis]|uniref:uracil-DNA glycosylase n=1 Tax=Listeria costaricensis TaxID=2026604 RepID=UPI000C088C47|nr:uracil-DNA glycosylase [Listeria costaricensis]